MAVGGGGSCQRGTLPPPLYPSSAPAPLKCPSRPGSGGADGAKRQGTGGWGVGGGGGCRGRLAAAEAWIAVAHYKTAGH